MVLLPSCNVVCAQQSTAANRGPVVLPVPSNRAQLAPSSRCRPVSSSATVSGVSVCAPPTPPAPIHTTAYLQHTKQLVLPTLARQLEEDEVEEQQREINSNAIVWALKKVDDQLNQVEQQPNQLHKAVYDFSNGPVGQATSKGVQTAAKFTMTATIEAAKAAAPVGKWALQQGFKAAVTIVGAAMQQEQKQKQQRKQQQQSK